MKNLLRTKYSVRIKICLFALLLSQTAVACDICGCFMGLTPYDNQSSFGILYRYRSFHGYPGQDHQIFPNGSRFFIPKTDKTAPITTHQNDPNDYEVYRTMEIRGRYFLHKRIELSAILPYNSNTERYNSHTATIAGLGDINLYGGYHLIRKLDQETINQRLIVGAGIKLATGKHTMTSASGLRYGTLMQPGTGSTDGFVYVNYLLGYRKFGMSVNSAYKFNGTNAKQEGIANSNTTFLNFFITKSLSKNWQIMPSLQFFYEYSKGETYLGARTGEHQMNNLMAGLGADLYFKNIALNVGFQKNAWQKSTDHPQSVGKIYLGITYNFNQLYYLIKS